jgi:hypothetical protein
MAAALSALLALEQTQLLCAGECFFGLSAPVNSDLYCMLENKSLARTRPSLNAVDCAYDDSSPRGFACEALTDLINNCSTYSPSRIWHQIISYRPQNGHVILSTQ